MPLTPEELKQIRETFSEELTTARAADQAEIARLKAEKEAAETEAETQRGAAEAANRRPPIYGGDTTPGAGIRSVPMSKEERQHHVIQRIGNAARGLAVAARSGGNIRAADFIEQTYGDKATADAVTRSLSTGVAGDGGNLVETQYAADMIELLYPMAAVRGSGAQVIPMPNGNLTIHRQNGGVSGAYAGELNNLPVQQPTTDIVQLNAKKLAVIVPASNELLHDTTGRVNQMIVDDIGMGLSLREDLAFLRGDGTSNTPTGILNQVAAGNKVTYATLTAALGGLRALIRGANIPMRRMGWIFNSDVESRFYNVLSTTGEYIYREEMDAGRLLGVPYKISNQIPSNLTTAGGTAGTELYFGDWSEVLIGEALALALDTSTEGSYFNGTTLVNAFSTDQTLFRARTRHDLALRHNKALAVGRVDLATVTDR
ncbi:phage major capsid protein [Deinococcus humi]|uniref:HK97 family phage major capsid protein n=1 Tax=Deinococcus humi TaxID=662880 RepID=A0A7W8JSS7_9DEIO|nr:phage major capsid protein [Deinococcus humi]MBB5361338.1 HK97 family phage major capsid protein [Deinococcus humi]GGO19536.1 phage capsid protein [Deinococcus humi]